MVYWVCHREFEGKIKTVTVSKKPDGQYYASVLVDDGKEKPKPPAKDEAIGIDFGLTYFAVSREANTNRKRYSVGSSRRV